jgi:pyruvate/2-oxoglutarate dehydrogenase complex dihydrolipoamide dehydrogenase (E3) component
MRTAASLGLSAADPQHDLAQVMAKVHSIREHIYDDADAPPHFEKLGVEVIEGRAGFVDPHTVEVVSSGSRRSLTSRYFVIATGSRPRAPEIPGGQSANVLNNESIFELKQLPRHLVVLGAGPIGIELGQAFRRLGSEVTVVNRSPGILRRDDPELSAMLLEHLRKEGIRFVFGTVGARIEPQAVHLENGDRLECDAILAAAGRKPGVDGLNLAAAGVETNEKGIVVDRRCRSSAKHIYACGDVAGRYLFTHFAEHMGKTAVTNAILHVPAKLDESNMTWVTFTDPELAHVGRSEEDLKREGVKHSVFRFPYTQLDRAITESATTGMVKVMANNWGRVLGVSILGVSAGEMIGEYALAVRNGVRLDKISSTIHPYPTYVLGNRRAADLYMMRKLTPTMVRWLQRIFRLRGDTRGVTALQQM